MPELPEVETTVRDLKNKVLGRTFVDVWTDAPKLIKKPGNFEEFKRSLKGKTIEDIKRRAKNILIHLSSGHILLIHQKMTGHLLLGKWKLEKGLWKSLVPGPLAADLTNRFLHFIFWLDNGEMLALSDMRKFAKLEIWGKGELEESSGFLSLGPEPLEKDFTLKKLKEAFSGRKGKIKKVLMDQSVISGIGNIYSDEILWAVKINPLKDVSKLSDKELSGILRAAKNILKKAIKSGGESFSDFRRIYGQKGGFDPFRKVYRWEGQPCFRCGAKIKRIKIGGRSAHYCPVCQK